MQKQSLLLPDDNSSHRIPLYDALKGLAIIFVVYAHCLQYLGIGEYIHHSVVCFIYSFHMPLFMTLSGYFAYPLVSSIPFGTFVWRKVVRLLIPAVCFGLLTLTIMSVTGHHVKNGWFSYMYGNLWYLKSLFLCLLISRISATILGNEIRAALITVVLSWFLPNLFHINFMLPFFWLGYFLRYKPSALSSRGLALLSFILWMLLSIFWDGTHTTYLAPFGLMDYPDIRWAPHNLYSYMLRVMIGIAATWCILSFFARLYSKGVRLFTLERLGRHTLAIYALQTLWIELMVTYGISFGYKSFLYEVIYCPAMTLLIVLVSYVIALVWAGFKSKAV